MAKEIKQKEKAPLFKDKTAGYFVTSPFRDKSDFSKLYNIGDDVSHFDAERLENLVKNGLCSNDK